MLAVLNCIGVEHNLWFVLLAALLCVASSASMFFLYDWSRRAPDNTRLIWVASAGISGGFGIWSTHFVAMLGYRGEAILGYQGEYTLLSLALPIAAVTLAILLAHEFRNRLWSALAGGTVLGGGVAAMHYLGMMAIVVPGEISWKTGYVLASVVFSVVLSVLSFLAITAPGRNERLRTSMATVSLVAGIVLLHFIGMTAIRVVAGPLSGTDAFNISPLSMVVTIVAVCISLLAAGTAAASFAIRSERAVAEGSANFRLLLQGVKDYAIYMLDPEGRVSNWNPGAERAKGYRAEEIVGQYFGVFYSPEDQAAGRPARALESARRDGKFEAQGWRFRKDGSSFWAQVSIDAIHDEAGALIGFAKITKDNTAEKQAADQLRTLSRNLDAALENMPHGICMFDGDERLVFVNRRYAQILRVPPELVLTGERYTDLLTSWFRHGGRGATMDEADRRAGAYRDRILHLLGKGGGSFVETLPSGHSIQMSYNPMANGGWVATFEDVTERLRSEEKIAHMAHHDSLTGLANRSYFSEYLEMELELSKSTAGRIAVVAVDLNEFKEINDQHGHHTGDLMLGAVAKAMQECLKPGEFVARLGGDEFAAAKRFQDIAEVHDFAARLEAAIGATVNHDGYELRVTGSLGIALSPDDGTAGGQLMANADMAMYRAKNSLLHRICFYEAQMDETARERRSLASELWQALERDQFLLHYQIQRSVSTGRTTGHEVLLRWHHPERGNIPPMDFIPLAEECGAILPIGEWVLRTACREAVAWTHGGKIAVNLSPVQIAHADMPELVRRVLAETGLSPDRLELEITESAIIVDKQRALQALRDIKALGVSIAIDDFGTGYSSLETLRAFPFDKIKLDRSFMAELERDAQAKAIVRAILALGRSLDVTVLAEGVETASQMEILFAEGCQEAQGYLLGRPVRPDFSATIEDAAPPAAATAAA